MIAESQRSCCAQYKREGMQGVYNTIHELARIQQKIERRCCYEHITSIYKQAVMSDRNIQCVGARVLFQCCRPKTALFMDSKSLSWNEVERSRNNRQNSRDDNKNPVHNPLRLRDRIAKDLEMESERQNDANSEASDRSKQTHDAIELRDQNTEYDENDSAKQADDNFEDTAVETGHSV